MTQGRATLVVDFGNSETRGIVLYGKDSAGRVREKSFMVSNRFADVPSAYVPSTDYTEDTSSVICVDASVDGKQFLGSYVNGEVQAKEFRVAPLRPSALKKKYSSPITLLSFTQAMLQAHKIVMGMTRTASFDQLDITWNVLALLPPGDIDSGAKKMSELLKSTKRLVSTFPVCDIELKVDKVAIYPEGFCAYIGTVFDKGYVFRPNYESMVNEITLVLDVGAGTSDALVVQDNKLISESRHTVSTGGNNVTRLVEKALKNNHNGLTLPDNTMQEGIVTGIVRDGAKEIDISEYVNQAKSEIAKAIIADIQDYFEETQFPVRSISKLLVCGGGALSGSEDGKIISLSDAIVDYLKELTPNVELVPLPVVTTTKEVNGEFEKVEEQISPRMLNVFGASILAELVF